jgi:phosphoribosylglycinamide formyltransferase 1
LLKIAVLISGSGSNLQAVLDKISKGLIDCQIEWVISDRSDAYGLERAKSCGIKTLVLDRKIYGDKLSDKILGILDREVDLIVLAGFLSILRGSILSVFKNRIINIHPSLIPSFCGNGMYGLKIHEKAIETGVCFSGCTVHFVDEGTDTGPIILQRIVPVHPEDSALTLQRKILEEEHGALSEAIKLISEERVKVIGKKVLIT